MGAESLGRGHDRHRNLYVGDWAGCRSGPRCAEWWPECVIGADLLAAMVRLPAVWVLVGVTVAVYGLARRAAPFALAVLVARSWPVRSVRCRICPIGYVISPRSRTCLRSPAEK